MRKHRKHHGHAKTRALKKRYGQGAKRRPKFCAVGSHPQAALFPKSRYTVAEAKEWAKDHGWKSSDVDVPPSGRFIHLRQEDPSHFKRIRIKHLGKSGIELRVGWERC